MSTSLHAFGLRSAPRLCGAPSRAVKVAQPRTRRVVSGSSAVDGGAGAASGGNAADAADAGSEFVQRFRSLAEAQKVEVDNGSASGCCGGSGAAVEVRAGCG